MLNNIKSALTNGLIITNLPKTPKPTKAPKQSPT